MTAERRTRVQGNGKPRRHPDHVPAGTITWDEHMRVYEAYAARYGRGQSAERIAERGGFGFDEAVGLCGGVPLQTYEPTPVVEPVAETRNAPQSSEPIYAADTPVDE